jgi:flagellar protein FliO/FliZ
VSRVGILISFLLMGVLSRVFGAEPAGQDAPASSLSPGATLTPRSPSTLIATEKGPDSRQLIVYFVVIVALAGGGFYFLKRGLPLRGSRGGANHLQLLETKMLGNRQFLVVVKYEDSKMLLGVGPGQMQYLCALDSADDDLEKLVRKTSETSGLGSI